MANGSAVSLPLTLTIGQPYDFLVVFPKSGSFPVSQAYRAAYVIGSGLTLTLNATVA